MPSCSICLEPFASPVSLPCGHVFCRECVRRTVNSAKSCTLQHLCPACRAPYPIVTMNPALIPPYLRPHILPPLRKVFFNDDPTPTAAPIASSSTSGSPAAASADLARLLAEVHVLREHCATWRRRAEVHAAGNTTLLNLTRAAKDCALRMRAERDTERSQCLLLKRKLAELMSDPESESESDSNSTSNLQKRRPPVPPCGLPVFLMQMKCTEDFYDNPADMTKDHFGPPMKRRKHADDLEPSIFFGAPPPATTTATPSDIPSDTHFNPSDDRPALKVRPRIPDVTALPRRDSIFVSSTLVSPPP